MIHAAAAIHVTALAGALIYLTIANAATFSIEGSLIAALAAAQADDMVTVAIRTKEVRDAVCERLMKEGEPNPVDGNGQWVCDVRE